MRKYVVNLAVAVGASVSLVWSQPRFVPQEVWSLDGFEAPESVYFDKGASVLYVSNVNGAPGDKDANGYISKVGLDGKFISQKWVTGLNAPKGLGKYKDILYVADIDQIVAISISKAEIINKYDAPGATFLNDIVVDARGDVYASNTFGGASIVYKLSGNQVEEWLKDDALNMPNGLLIKGGYLYVSSWGTGLDPETFKTKMPGKLLRVQLKTKKIQTVIDDIGNLDGLTETVHGLLVSDWIAGKLIYTSDFKTTKEIKTLSPGTADIFFEKSSKMLYVPLMLDGRLVAFKI